MRVRPLRAKSTSLVTLTVIALLAMSCGDGHRAKKRPCPPAIDMVAPTVGDVAGGDQVAIVTSCFADNFTSSLPQVFFGPDPALSIVAANSTTLTVVTPPHTIAEPVDVIVQATGMVQTATLLGGFTYLNSPPPPPCSVTNVLPNQAFRDAPTTVIVEGTNFPTIPPVPSVQFGAGNFGTNVIQIDPETLQVDTPIVGMAGTVDVILTPVGTASCIGPSLFTYLDPPVLQCTAIDVTPNQGFRDVSNTVVVEGTNFPIPPDPAPTVEFGTGAFGTNVVQIDSGTLQVDTPIVGMAGTVDVIVTPVGAGSCIGLGLFTFLDPPVACTISAVDPDWGPEFGGATVTITGTGFTPTTQVSFGSSAATVSVIDAMTVEAVVPAGLGSVDVVVDVGAGITCSASGAFAYISCGAAPCTISGVTPTSGGVGDMVTIAGTAFEARVQVFFGTVQAPVMSVAPPDEIVVTVPPPSGGQLVVDVQVVNPSGVCCVQIGGFIYNACNITRVNPIRGSTAGGETVTIDGNDFDPQVEVYFGGIQADPGSITVDASGMQVTCVTPSSATAGMVSVQVQNLLSSSFCISECGYIYDAPGGGFCAITGLVPGSGPVLGGNVVTITGAGFDAGSQVHFGPDPALSVAFIGAGTLEAVAPPYGGSLGPQPVTVDIAVVPVNANPCVLSGAYTYQ